MAGKRQDASRARRRTMQRARGRAVHDPHAELSTDEERAELKRKEAKLVVVQHAVATGGPLLPARADSGDDRPPLVGAVMAGDVRTLQQLIDSGADLDAGVPVATGAGDVSILPMDLALHGERPEVVAALLHAGVPMDSHWLVGSWLHAYISMYPAATAMAYQMQVGKRFTPIGVQRALEKRHPGYLAVTRVLLHHGGDPDAVDSYEKTSPLRKALKFKMNALAELLRHRGEADQ